MTDQTEPPADDTPPPTRKERIAQLADKLCRTYTHGIDLESLEETDPEEAGEHRSAARRLLKWIEEAPEEEKESAFKRGFDLGRERQKQRTARDMDRLEAEVAELRQDRDPEGLRERIRALEYALRGWDTLMTGRDRRQYGAVPDWRQVAAEHLARLVEAERELAVLKGHQPSNATRRD